MHISKRQRAVLKKQSMKFGLGLLTAAGIGIGIHAAASAIAGKKNSDEKDA